jgi:hypothetical protein
MKVQLAFDFIHCNSFTFLDHLFLHRLQPFFSLSCVCVCVCMCVYNWRMKMGTLNFVILGRWVHSNLLVFLFCWLPSVSPTDMLSGPWRRITELLVVKPPCLWALVWPSNSSQAFHSHPSLHANNWVFFFKEHIASIESINLLFDSKLIWFQASMAKIPNTQHPLFSATQRICLK